eukprot:TRINITY_DN4991_c0_g1_i2.p1 TRINITY_DN4991_c0_g1~~TRINITY_DN4991_c0_g1_i2.p1  ORF type:complete len:477 (-),score=69.78 TRINITY_DN4991_c0_g1_i2:122-1552(-)
MSDSYADRLAPRDNLGGQLGAPENFDDENILKNKINELTQMVKEAKKIVFFTGAGISTASGIPDFRGPNGIWTLQKQGKKIQKNTTPFYAAKPTLTHMAIVGFFNEGKVQYIISQNVDCLHLRSGVPRKNLAELHGNCFAERCPKCKFEYIRTFEQETVGKKATGRSCQQLNCTGRLRDNILDWEDDLPEDEYSASLAYAKKAELMIVLGSSLQVTPANDIPVETARNGGKLVIVNLQETPKDKHANLVIRGKADDVMKQLANDLKIPIPNYIRQERINILTQQYRPKIAKDGLEYTELFITVYGQDGLKYAIPMVQKMSIKFPDLNYPANCQLRGQKGCQPVSHHIQTAPGALTVVIEVEFVEQVDSNKREELAEFEVYLYNGEEFDKEVIDKKQRFVQSEMELGFIVQCTGYMSQEEIGRIEKTSQQTDQQTNQQQESTEKRKLQDLQLVNIEERGDGFKKPKKDGSNEQIEIS